MGLYDPSPFPEAPAEGAEALATNSMGFLLKQVGILVGNGSRTVFTMQVQLDPDQLTGEPTAWSKSSRKRLATQPEWSFEGGGVLKITFAVAPASKEEIVVIVEQ